MMNRQSVQPALLWSAILGLVAVLGSYGLACVFPFAALAAIAAVTLPRTQAALLIGGVFTVNQIVGFALLHYGDSASAPVWGVVIAIAAFAALAAAMLAYGRETRLLAPRTGYALAASILAYQAVMFVGAWALDGFASSTLEIVLSVARNDVLWFAGLAAIRLSFTAVAEPIRARLVSAS